MGRWRTEAGLGATRGKRGSAGGSPVGAARMSQRLARLAFAGPAGDQRPELWRGDGRWTYPRRSANRGPDAAEVAVVGLGPPRTVSAIDRAVAAEGRSTSRARGRRSSAESAKPAMPPPARWRRDAAPHRPMPPPPPRVLPGGAAGRVTATAGIGQGERLREGSHPTVAGTRSAPGPEGPTGRLVYHEVMPADSRRRRRLRAAGVHRRSARPRVGCARRFLRYNGDGPAPLRGPRQPTRRAAGL